MIYYIYIDIYRYLFVANIQFINVPPFLKKLYLG